MTDKLTSALYRTYRRDICEAACEGVPDAALEPGAVMRLVGAANRLLNDCEGCNKEAHIALDAAIAPFREGRE